MTDEPLISIVVLTWNRLEPLKECLTHIIDRTRVPYVLYVVNNGSTDGTREYLDNLESRGVLKAVHLDKNYGVTARNHAFKLVTTPYIAQVDDDVSVNLSWAQTCLDQLEKNPQIGIVASQGANVEHWLSLYVTFREGPADCATGFFMCFRNLGILYDESFSPFWHEEIDFSFEYRIRGYAITVVHGLSAHKCKRTSFDVGLERRNFLYVKEKWQNKIGQLNLLEFKAEQ
jgi:glycosyltransferase involved in cell wall biosynthesis